MDAQVGGLAEGVIVVARCQPPGERCDGIHWGLGERGRLRDSLRGRVVRSLRRRVHQAQDAGELDRARLLPPEDELGPEGGLVAQSADEVLAAGLGVDDLVVGPQGALVRPPLVMGATHRTQAAETSVGTAVDGDEGVGRGERSGGLGHAVLLMMGPGTIRVVLLRGRVGPVHTIYLGRYVLWTAMRRSLTSVMYRCSNL